MNVQVDYNYAREMAAATTIARGINPAETQYKSRYGRYAISLAELAQAHLLPEDLSNGGGSGYKYTLIGTAPGYQVNAEPTVHSDATTSFYSDQSLSIHCRRDRTPATASDPEFGAAPK